MIKEQYVYIKNGEVISHSLVPISIEYDDVRVIEIDSSRSFILKLKDGEVLVDYVITPDE